MTDLRTAARLPRPFAVFEGWEYLDKDGPAPMWGTCSAGALLHRDGHYGLHCTGAASGK
jgi:hypothetical protein